MVSTPNTSVEAAKADRSECRTNASADNWIRVRGDRGPGATPGAGVATPMQEMRWLLRPAPQRCPQREQVLSGGDCLNKLGDRHIHESAVVHAQASLLSPCCKDGLVSRSTMS